MRQAFSLLAVVLLVAGQQAIAKSVTYDLTPMMTDPSGEIELLGGKTVRLPTLPMNGAKVVFEDTMPEANWGHPGFIRLVSPEGEVLEEIKTDLPPLHLDLTKILDGVPAESNGVEFKLDNFKGKHKVKNPENRYVFLLNGRADLRHWNDFSFLYRTLTQIYGYKKENIFIADGAFKDRLGDLDGDGEADIQYGSTKKDLENIMAKLADTLTPEDHLVFAVNDHGSTMDGESTIVLYRSEIKASEFKVMFDKIKAKSILSIHEQCFSGGFVRPTVGRNRVTMAAATDNEYSWASMDLNFDEFIYHVIVAFARQTHSGKKVNADTNRDGKISAKEAFAYAVANDQRKESPIMESLRNSGNADTIGLDF